MDMALVKRVRAYPRDVGINNCHVEEELSQLTIGLASNAVRRKTFPVMNGRKVSWTLSFRVFTEQFYVAVKHRWNALAKSNVLAIIIIVTRASNESVYCEYTFVFSVRLLSPQSASSAPVIRVITVASRKRVHATCMPARARAHNGRRSKFYPHLAIIQPCRFILLRLRVASSPAHCPSHRPAPTRSVSPRVVTHTLVQRANIDKSAEAKTSER